MIDLREIWQESLDRFTEKGVKKITETPLPVIVIKGFKTYFNPRFGEELLRLGVELLHEEIADVEELR